MAIEVHTTIINLKVLLLLSQSLPKNVKNRNFSQEKN